MNGDILKLIKCILLIILIPFGSFGQKSFQKAISEAKAVSKNPLEQIEALKVLEPEIKASNYFDTLALLHYGIAFRYKNLYPKYSRELAKHASKTLYFVGKSGLKHHCQTRAFNYLGEYYENLNPDSSFYYFRRTQVEYLRDNPKSYQDPYFAFSAIASKYSEESKHQEAYNYLIALEKEPFFESLNAETKYYYYIKKANFHAYANIEEEFQDDFYKNYNLAKQQISKYENETFLLLHECQYYSDLGLINLEKKNYIAAIKNFKNLAELDKSLLDTLSSNEYNYNANTNLFNAYAKLEQYKTALNHILLVEKEYNKIPNPTDYTKRVFLDNKAMALAYAGRFDESIELINEGISLYMDPSESIKNTFTNNQKAGIMNLLYDKADILHKKYKAHKDIKDIDESLHNILKVDSLFNIYMQEIIFEDGVYDWREKALKYYHLGIELAYIKKDYPLMWTFFEKNKGTELLKQFGMENKKQTNLDSLKVRIKSLENKIAINDDLNDFQKDSLSSTLTNLKHEEINIYMENSKAITLKFPQISIEETLEKMPKNSVLINFSEGIDAYYAIILQDNEFEISRIEGKENIRDLVNSYYKSIYSQESLTEIQKVSRNLYSILLNDQTFPENYSLIIIPDPLLSFVPFETLIDTSGDYLIEKHPIGYHISGSLYHLTSKRKYTSRNTNIIAPDYHNNVTQNADLSQEKHELSELPFAKYESESLKKIMRGQLFKSITKSQFDSIYTNSDIVHFSGHAVIEKSDNALSYLALSSNGLNEKIYADQISIHKNEPVLVSLSACNTLPGKIRPGEGIFGLNRAFLTSGTQSVVSTLWEVTDESTSKIIISFYENLMKNNMSKTLALQQAKINYLENAPDYLRHPYYWAGTVLNGNADPIKTNQLNFWNIALLFVTFSIIFFIFKVGLKNLGL